jgi:hypothetical protein
MNPGQFNALEGMGAAACILLFWIFALLLVHVRRHWNGG